MTHTRQTIKPAVDAVSDGDAQPRIMAYVILGLFALVSFAGGAIYWSLSSKLDGAVVAPASFAVEGDRKTVEHIDGGLIQSILITDGAFVEKGQPLIRLDSAEIDVEFNVTGGQLGELAVRRARLLAQISGAERFEETQIKPYLQDGLDHLHWHLAYVTQKQLFETEARARQIEGSIKDQQINGLKDQIDGLEEQRVTTRKQFDLLEEEYLNLQSLHDQGLSTSSEITSRRVEMERLSGNEASLRTQITQAMNQIQELKLTRISQRKLRDEAIASELAVVEAQLTTVAPQFRGIIERRKRIEIIAPVSGRVVDLDVSTDGGVIRPGERILDIVPSGQTLIVEARIKPTDIDKLRVGQETRIRLSAFAQADVPEANGEIVGVSADALEDERTGEEYYLARVTLDQTQPEQVEQLELVPGMPADIFIVTGERTAFSYLSQPIKERLARTFVE